MPKRSTRKRTEIIKRRSEAAFLFLQGATMEEIAQKFGVNRAQISRDLKAVREEWAERYAGAINEQKAKELAKIDHLERVAWQAWDDSKTERTEQSVGLAASGGKTSNVRKVQRDGNPQFLAEVRWCIEQRCKLYGLYAPAKQEVTGKDGGPIQTNATHDLSALSLEELHVLRDIVTKTTAT